MKRIALVDDEVDILEAVAELLGAEGYEVLTAGNGRLALEVIRAARPDAIVVDIMMPVMTGIEMLTELHKSAEWRDIPVLIISAGDERHTAASLGAHFLRKPFDIDDLLAAVKKVVA